MIVRRKHRKATYLYEVVEVVTLGFGDQKIAKLWRIGRDGHRIGNWRFASFRRDADGNQTDEFILYDKVVD